MVGKTLFPPPYVEVKRLCFRRPRGSRSGSVTAAMFRFQVDAEAGSKYRFAPEIDSELETPCDTE